MPKKRYRFQETKKVSIKKENAALGFETQARTLVRSLCGLVKSPQRVGRAASGRKRIASAVSSNNKAPRTRRRQGRPREADNEVEFSYDVRQRNLYAETERPEICLPVRDPGSGNWIATTSVRDESAASGVLQPGRRNILVRRGARSRPSEGEAAGQITAAAEALRTGDIAGLKPKTRPASNEARMQTNDQHTRPADTSPVAGMQVLNPSAPSATPTPDALGSKLRKFILLVTGTCAAIAENPEREIVKLQSLGRLLRELSLLHRSAQREPLLRAWSSKAICLCVRAFTELFTEICPGYWIRTSAESNDSVRLSKTIIRLRAFEKALLGAYKAFLGFLRRHIASKNRCRQRESTRSRSLIGSVCLRSCQDLLLQLSHFNEADELIDMLVPQFGTREHTDADLVATAIELMNQLESSSGASLRAVVHLVRALCRRLGDEGIRTPTAVLHPLLKIPFEALHATTRLRDARLNATERKTNVSLSRRKRGRMQHETLRRWMEEKQQLKRDVDAQLARDMRDMQAEASPEEQQWARQQVMTAVSQAYLRCLVQMEAYFHKNDSAGAFTKSASAPLAVASDSHRTASDPNVSALGIGELVPLIAEGLGQIALYVNARLLNDLLATMYRVIGATFDHTTYCVSPLVRLRCIRGSYQILIAQQIATQGADPTVLDGILFRAMDPAGATADLAPSNRGAWQRELLAVVELGLLGSRRILPSRRGVAFWMRLIECALHSVQVADARSFVQLALALVDRYPALRAWILSTEADDGEDQVENVSPTPPVGLVPTSVGHTTASQWNALADPDIVGAMLFAGQAVATDLHGQRVSVRELYVALCERHSDRTLQKMVQRLRTPLASW
ncbi:hypothetical protein CCYA_CCYA02G0469 [Cyanidiococcus yangmingshanensis]|nr:hypothetical protein CCYA_CCYA02G0469 [Cyanidiococcus yangmingshanensis]